MINDGKFDGKPVICGCPYHGRVTGTFGNLSLALPNGGAMDYPNVSGGYWTQYIKAPSAVAPTRTTDQQTSDTALGREWRADAIMVGNRAHICGQHWPSSDYDYVALVFDASETPYLLGVDFDTSTKTLTVTVLCRYGRFPGQPADTINRVALSQVLTLDPVPGATYLGSKTEYDLRTPVCAQSPDGRKIAVGIVCDIRYGFEYEEISGLGNARYLGAYHALNGVYATQRTIHNVWELAITGTETAGGMTVTPTKVKNSGDCHNATSSVVIYWENFSDATTFETFPYTYSFTRSGTQPAVIDMVNHTVNQTTALSHTIEVTRSLCYERDGSLHLMGASLAWSRDRVIDVTTGHRLENQDEGYDCDTRWETRQGEWSDSASVTISGTLDYDGVAKVTIASTTETTTSTEADIFERSTPAVTVSALGWPTFTTDCPGVTIETYDAFHCQLHPIPSLHYQTVEDAGLGVRFVGASSQVVLGPYGVTDTILDTAQRSLSYDWINDVLIKFPSTGPYEFQV